MPEQPHACIQRYYIMSQLMNIDNILMMSKIQKNMLSYTLCRIYVYNLFMFISAYIFYKCMFKVLFVDL